MALSAGLTRLLDEGLDDQQREAASAGAGPLCVIAGAGAGKTRTLVARAAYAVEVFEITPSEIQAISFTNKACGEISERIQQVIGDWGQAINVNTFHAAAWRMIVGPNRERLGRRSAVSILSGEDSRRICKRAIEDVGRAAEGISPREAQRQIALHKAHNRSPGSIIGPGGSGAALAAIWQRYRQITRAMSAFDFEDMLAAACHLLEEDDALRANVQSRCKLLLLDEYQDASPSQRRFATLLGGGGVRNVTAIGDEDQAVYAWRGGDATGLIRFAEDYPGAESVVLTNNYRSKEEIVAAGQRLVGLNFERREKVLRSALGEGGLVSTTLYEDEEAECEDVAMQLTQAALWGEGGEVAALARTAYHLKRIETRLTAAEVPFRVLGAQRALESAEVQDALAYLALVNNPRNELAAARCGTREPGVGEAALRHARGHAERSGSDLVTAFADARSIEGLHDRQRRGLRSIAHKAQAVERVAQRRELVEAVRLAVEGSGWPAELAEEDRSEAERRRTNIGVLEALAETEQANGGDLEGLLGRVALGASSPGDDEEVITLATVHQAKGLEWRRVHLVGVSEGTLPHHYATTDDDPASLEAERRVAYVGITRAREELRVTGSERVRGRAAGLSRFCQEAGLVGAGVLASIVGLAFNLSIWRSEYASEQPKIKEAAIERSHHRPAT